MSVMDQLTTWWKTQQAKKVKTEWTGRTIRIDLKPLNPAQWDRFLKKSTRRNVWVELRQEWEQAGPKLVTKTIRKGVIVGALSAAQLRKEPELAQARAQGVNAGVVRLTRHEGEKPEAVLVLGKDYKYRPKPPWE